MAVSVNWATKVISVPQSYLTLISGVLYELDTDQFRLDLKALEASTDGMSFEDTHRHNTEVTIGGVTYARTFEIINGYTVTFEDGQYRVRFVGSNNNIADVTNLNQVSLLSQNSGGLVSTAADVASAVWAASSSGTAPGTFGRELILMRGQFDRYVIDGGPGQAVLQKDAAGLMLTGRIRIFATSAAAAAATMGAANDADGEIARSDLSAAAAVAGQLDNMRMLGS